MLGSSARSVILAKFLLYFSKLRAQILISLRVQQRNYLSCQPLAAQIVLNEFRHHAPAGEQIGEPIMIRVRQSSQSIPVDWRLLVNNHHWCAEQRSFQSSRAARNSSSVRG